MGPQSNRLSIRADHAPALLRAGLVRDRRSRAGVAASTSGRARRRRLRGRRAPHSRTSAPKAKRVIYLFMAGAPSQLDCSTTSRRCTKHDGQDIPEELDQGRALRLHQGHAEAARLAVPVQTARPVGRRDLRAAAAPVEDRRRHRHRPVDAHDAVQPRAGADLHEHRAPGDRAAEHGLLAHLRPRQRERGPAGFVVLLSGENNPDGGKSCWGSGFLPDRVPGRRVPIERRPGAVRVEPGGHRRRTRRRDRSTRSTT